MGKHYKIIVMLLFSIVLFSGCMQTDATLHLNEDGSGKIDITHKLEVKAMEETFREIGYLDEPDFDEQLVEMVKDSIGDDYEVELTDNRKYITMKKEESFDEINNFESEDFLSENHFFKAEITKASDNHRKVTFYIEDDLSDYPEEEIELLGEFEVNFHAILPGKPKKHNAHKVKNNTLTWDLLEIGEGDGEYIVLEAEYGTDDTFPVLPLAGGTLVVAIILIFLLKRKDKPEESFTE